jgi:hypothetical protein
MVAIGYAVGGEEPKILASNVICDATEGPILRDWWGMVSEWIAAKCFIVGHNSNNFDWPFLIRRSWKLGVTVPREVMQGRYLSPLLKDTQDVWFFGQRQLVRLDTLAKFFGVGCKPEGEGECTGAMFAKMWEAGGDDRVKAAGYLKNDINMTRGVAKALGLF